MGRGVWYTCAPSLAIALLAALPLACARAEETPAKPEALAWSRAALNAHPSVHDFVVYASNSAQLQISTMINGGDVGVQHASAGPFLFPNFEVAVHGQARIETTRNLLADAVLLDSGAVVGDVQTNLLSDQGAQHGNLGTVPPMPALAPVSTVMPGTANLFVSTSQTIGPGGTYGTLAVGSGATLRLQGGVYHVRQLALVGTGRIEAEVQSEIRVAGRMTMGTQAFIGPSAGSPLVAKDIRIEVSGANGGSGLPDGTPSAANIGSMAETRALLLAPNGTIRVGADARVTGALQARDVEVGARAVVTFEGGFPAATCSESCDDNNSCTADFCVDGVCIHDAAPDGKACNDGNACTTDEVCLLGVCASGTAVSCAALDACHVAGTCDPATGQCSNPAAPDGTSCDDGSACTQADACVTGACLGTNPIICTALDQCHLAGACDPASGVCSNPAKPNGEACDDGNACTSGDVCGGGGCIPGAPLAVDDGNPCTGDSCDPTGGVAHVAVALGTACSDGDACNGAETCDGNGACTAGSPVICTVLDACHDLGICDPATGACTNPPRPDGTVCNDANACTQIDVCTSGFCVGTTPVLCTASDACHVSGTCDTATGVCSNPEAPDGTACNDGNACTRTDSCQAGACAGSNEVVCAALDQCHVPGTCDTGTGTCSNPPIADGTACNDNDACTAGDVCQSGGCHGGAVAIDDGNPCTADSCDPASGVVHASLAAGTACPDGDACNGPETCDGNGACQPGAPPLVDDQNPCTADSCDPATGVSHGPLAEGTSCKDGDVCNGDETCDATGSCQAGTPLVLDDQNPCTADSCDAVSGVAHVALAAGTACADGNVCNGDETCDGAGACLPGTPLAMDDGDPCTADGCDPLAGVFHGPAAAGTSCADSNVCNGNEICDGNFACVTGPPAVIDDGNPCTLDTCDVVAGIIHHACAAVDRTVSSLVFDTTSFLYSGDSPVQTGAAAGSIQAPRAAVLKGRALGRDNSPIFGVTISVADHPELGTTKTQGDGGFDLAVNGGQPLTVKYAMPGYLPVQRQVQVPWRDFASVPEVVLTAPDALVTSVDLSAAGMQLARGSVATDDNGTRRPTLLIAEGTQATLTLSDQTTQTLTTLNVRVTEYSVGSGGARSLPSDLPLTSAYTYAFELGANEAAPGSSLSLSQPAAFYTENFLDFPVGEVVPVGYFDAAHGAWMASENGRVVKIVGITDGAADIDVDGDGAADAGAALSALGIVDAERQSLATLYSVGQSLWRLRVQRFASWGAHWGFAPPVAASAPSVGSPVADSGSGPGASVEAGSKIETQRQALGERVAVAGTPFDLHYQSDRSLGRKAAFSLTIPISGATLPGPVQRIDLEIAIAGRVFRQTLLPSANQTATFTWDGRDAYGRLVQGAQPVRVRVGNTYDGIYQRVDRFGGIGNGTAVTGSKTRQEVTLWKEWTGSLGTWDASAMGVGGWSLGAHHVLDPEGHALYLGNGERRSGSDIPLSQTTVTAAGTGGIFLNGDEGPATTATVYGPSGVAVGPDGTYYIADTNNRVVRRVSPDGIIHAFAGGGNQDPGNGGPAAQARLNLPTSVAVGRDGSVYIGDGSTSNPGPRVRKVDANGIITTVAGTGEPGDTGDNGPATAAKIGEPVGLALGPDDTLYIAVGNVNRVRRVTPDGIITTIAGTGAGHGHFNEGGRATEATINTAASVAVGPDGTIFVVSRFDHAVRAITSDGVIRTVAGDAVSQTAGFEGDGGPATQAKLNGPSAVAVAADGTLYIADTGNQRIRVVSTNGIIATGAGTGAATFSGEGGPAAGAALRTPSGLAVEPTGSLLFADFGNNRVRRVIPSAWGFSVGDSSISSEDGRELYVFDGRGRHKQTIDTRTKAVRYQFAYDAAGRLASVTDADANTTVIEHDAGGHPTGITGPFGQQTHFAVDAFGYLSSIINPAGEAYQLTHSADGLLTALTKPNGGTYELSYDTLGLLIGDADPAGGMKTLVRTDIANGFDVDVITLLGRRTAYRTQLLGTGALERRYVSDGTQSSLSATPAALVTTALADGTTVAEASAPDPRFRMTAPVRATETRTPSGLTRSVSVARSAAQSSSDPLSYDTFTETTTKNGATWTEQFDVVNGRSTITTPAGRRTFVNLDVKSHVTSTQVDGLLATITAYDDRGRVATITRGDRQQTLSYDTNGLLHSLTDALSRTTLFARDGAGRVTETTLADDQVVDFVYDGNGNVTAVVPPGRPSHGMHYTAVDLLASYDPPIAGDTGTTSTTYGYDLDRMLTDIFRPDAAHIRETYDTAGRLSSVVLPAGTISYGYDAATGRLASIAGPSAEDLALGFDGSLATDVTFSGLVAGNVHWNHDDKFRTCLESINSSPSTCASPAPESIAFAYDNDDLLVAAGALSLTRDPRTGLVTATALGNVADSTTYNGFGEPAMYEARFQGAVLLSESYDTSDGLGARDALGHVTKKTETVQGVTHTYGYVYDVRNRLTDVTIDGAASVHYQYDANGNRLSKTSGAGVSAGTYDDQDRLLTYGTASYAYGANGELARKSDGNATQFTYDARGSLTHVDLPDGRSIDHVSDGLDRRVGKRVNGALVQGLLYADASRVVAETDGAGNVVARFVYASRPNVPDYVIKGADTYRLITDHLGSVRLVVHSGSGVVVQRLDYDEYGSVTLDSSPGFQPFGFAGGVYDPDTKLVRFGARDYDADVGRWTVKNPQRFAGGSPNLYLYGEGDPVNRIDPSGTRSQEVARTLPDLDWPAVVAGRL